MNEILAVCVYAYFIFVKSLLLRDQEFRTRVFGQRFNVNNLESLSTYKS